MILVLASCSCWPTTPAQVIRDCLESNVCWLPFFFSSLDVAPFIALCCLRLSCCLGFFAGVNTSAPSLPAVCSFMNYRINADQQR